MPRKKFKDEPKSSPPHSDTFPTPSLESQDLRMAYEIARGEQGVLTFEPYKSILLPHWRFRTVPIAEESSKTLEGAFKYYLDASDFVGADMARKFIQMGMTRAKRYANHAGGRKYDKSERELEKEGKGGKRTELPKSTDHAGRDEKLAASEIFKEGWRRCIEDADYLKLKAEWQKEKKEWQKGNTIRKTDPVDSEIDRKVKTETTIKQEVDEHD